MNKQLCDSKYDCCGCTACYAVCPVNAIAMEVDEEGFKYPRINREICINCKRCEMVCPFLKKMNDIAPLRIYAAKNRNEAIRKLSSSGGVFSLLADYVERRKGVIYGVAFDTQYSVRHMRAENFENWKEFCVSKYVQSDVGDSFRQVSEDLKSGRKVLFSGTPCQIEGLQNYLKNKRIDTSNLFTCDIVCHGVPSPKVWEDYLKYLQKKNSKSIGFVSFRDKSDLGWHNSALTIKDKLSNVIVSETHGKNLFSKLFFSHDILRNSCTQCKYSNFHRPGDITLGDFWGIEKNFAHFDDNKGVSLVMVNTKQGELLWNAIKQQVEFFEVAEEQCIQPNLQRPSEESKSRDIFWRWYNKYGLERVGQKMGYFPMNKREKILIFVYRCWEKILRYVSSGVKDK